MEAIKLHAELKPDLMTCDILMKNLTGIEALEKIMENTPQAKVIMVTAIGQESMQLQAKALGAKGYIRKPFKPEDVIAEINKVLAES
jgi:two-component system, chemotaxis family, chemotaxis protein CheY